MLHQTLAIPFHGPVWIMYGVAALFAVLSILLLSGKGSWLIAGYNTASPEEKAKYDSKKLCRVMGGGLLAITAMLIVMCIFHDRLPAGFGGLLCAVTVANSAVMILLCNTICKTKEK